MREIILDTETTGFDPAEGHRIVEIGCVELIDRRHTGKTWHVYLNPERTMPKDAEAVHGLTEEFLADKPVFAAVAADLLAFIGNSQMVAHNAPFDLAFLNAELERSGQLPLEHDRITDTLELAREKLPGSPNTLDALCRRFDINTTRRGKHGALIDADLLAQVYIELVVERSPEFDFSAHREAPVLALPGKRIRPLPLAPRLTEADIAAHRAFVAAAVTAPIWDDYWLEVNDVKEQAA